MKIVCATEHEVLDLDDCWMEEVPDLNTDKKSTNYYINRLIAKLQKKFIGNVNLPILNDNRGLDDGVTPPDKRKLQLWKKETIVGLHRPLRQNFLMYYCMLRQLMLRRYGIRTQRTSVPIVTPVESEMGRENLFLTESGRAMLTNETFDGRRCRV
uniref:Uncharacterized protein n=1 Tax=Romanomermis culicivorax TaxID=13658 RepID=A0A915K4D2_ROMCU